jgi:hypothetical protein
MSKRVNRWLAAAALGVLAAALSVGIGGTAASARSTKHSRSAKHSKRGRSAKHDGTRHVLLISVDGLHQSDLATWVHDNPASTLAQLTG